MRQEVDLAEAVDEAVRVARLDKGGLDSDDVLSEGGFAGGFVLAGENRKVCIVL